MTQPDDPPGFHRTYGVELLYESDPRLDTGLLVEKLRKRLGRVETRATPPIHHVAFPDFRVRYAGSEIPAQMIFGSSEYSLLPAVLEEALQQTWGWNGARDAVEGCSASFFLRDMMASGLPPRERLALFLDTLATVLEMAPCRAIYWDASGHIVDPQAFLAGRGNREELLLGALNARLFRIGNGGPGEMLMDTLGLAALGLPDVQCHFTDLEPEKVAELLLGVGCFLFRNGDVVADGDTVQGVTPTERWRCRREIAIAAPERLVLDIDLGPPHAAGGRR
ncbi:MAG TPA: DUF4261 domain-containing protein [Longimicrobiaceae bacterium]|jgi:hypothetical protein